MGFQEVCILVLALQALSAVRGRPSEVSPAEGTAAPTVAVRTPVNLLNKTMMSDVCVISLNTLATAQQLSGDWCDLEHWELTEEGIIPPRTCERLRIQADGDRLHMSVATMAGSDLISILNNTSSQIANESWLNEDENVNLFLRVSSSGRYLYMCGTNSPRDVVPVAVNQVMLARCSAPGEVLPPATRLQPKPLRCDVPQWN